MQKPSSPSCSCVLDELNDSAPQTKRRPFPGSSFGPAKIQPETQFVPREWAKGCGFVLGRSARLTPRRRSRKRLSTQANCCTGKGRVWWNFLQSIQGERP